MPADPQHQSTDADFPRLGIVTADLVAEVQRLLAEADAANVDLGAVNWADLGVRDVEYRLSMLAADAEPMCVVLVEEASPDSELGPWLNARLDKARFPRVFIECEW